MSADTTSASVGGTGSSRRDVEDFLTENDVLDYGRVGREDRMSDSDARKHWELVYRDVGAKSPEEKKDVRKVLYQWMLRNSTSGRADFSSSIVVMGKKLPMRRIMRDEVIPQDVFRRFARAEVNLREFEAVCRHEGSRVVLRNKAREKGVKPEYAIAAVDVAECFQLSGPEREEVMRVKGAVVTHAPPLATPLVERAATSGDGHSGGPPKPSEFSLSGTN